MLGQLEFNGKLHMWMAVPSCSYELGRIMISCSRSLCCDQKGALGRVEASFKASGKCLNDRATASLPKRSAVPLSAV